jgi:hypothetical protein
MYKGQVTISVEDIQEFLETGKLLQVKGTDEAMNDGPLLRVGQLVLHK